MPTIKPFPEAMHCLQEKEADCGMYVLFNKINTKQSTC